MKVANRNLESVVDIFRYKTDKCADGKDLFLCFSPGKQKTWNCDIRR